MVERRRIQLEDVLNDDDDEAADEASGSGRRGIERNGRYTKFNESYSHIAKSLCAMGASDVVLADAFKVSTATISNWKAKYPEFRKAIVEGKGDVFDPLVERALAQRAIGYAVDTEEIKVTKEGAVLRIPTRKFYPPDVTACIFWLKNRQPDRWRDVWKVEHQGEVGFKQLSSDQLLEEIRKDVASLGLSQKELDKLAAQGVAPGGGKTRH